MFGKELILKDCWYLTSLLVLYWLEVLGEEKKLCNLYLWLGKQILTSFELAFHRISLSQKKKKL